MAVLEDTVTLLNRFPQEVVRQVPAGHLHRAGTFDCRLTALEILSVVELRNAADCGDPRRRSCRTQRGA